MIYLLHVVLHLPINFYIRFSFHFLLVCNWSQFSHTPMCKLSFSLGYEVFTFLRIGLNQMKACLHIFYSSLNVILRINNLIMVMVLICDIVDNCMTSSEKMVNV